MKLKWISRLLFMGFLATQISVSHAAQDNGPRQDCWGKDTKCSDGEFRDWQGNKQPATCDNNFTTEESHRCKCMIAMTDADHCPPGGVKRDYQGMGPNCRVSCREKACLCVNQCDANEPDKKGKDAK